VLAACILANSLWAARQARTAGAIAEVER